MSTETTGVTCVIPGCGGDLLKETTLEYRGDPMHAIIGPGGRQQMSSRSELYCSDCGISYHHLPKQGEAEDPDEA